jgi:hypothetical protein
MNNAYDCWSSSSTCIPQFKCSDLVVLLNHSISMVVVCYCLYRLATLGLSLISVAPPLKCLTHHLTVLTSTVHSSYTPFRHLHISMGLTFLAVRNSITTLCFIRISVTYAILIACALCSCD